MKDTNHYELTKEQRREAYAILVGIPTDIFHHVRGDPDVTSPNVYPQLRKFPVDVSVMVMNAARWLAIHPKFDAVRKRRDIYRWGDFYKPGVLTGMRQTSTLSSILSYADRLCAANLSTLGVDTEAFIDHFDIDSRDSSVFTLPEAWDEGVFDEFADEDDECGDSEDGNDYGATDWEDTPTKCPPPIGGGDPETPETILSLDSPKARCLYQILRVIGYDNDAAMTRLQVDLNCQTVYTPVTVSIT